MATSPPGCVLVVDDDAATAAALRESLEMEGYDVRVARDGAEALVEVARGPVGVVLLDMQMPVLDGSGFAAAYRTTPEPRAPVIVLTAAMDAARRAREIGADAWLPKPFELEELLALVGRFCGQPSEPPR